MKKSEDIRVVKESYKKRKEWEKERRRGSGSYRIIGSLGNKRGKVKGRLLYENKEERSYYELPKSQSLYKIKGYLQVDEDSYVALVKNRIPEWIVLFLCAVAVILLIVYLAGGFGGGNKGPNIDKGAGKYKPDNQISEQGEPGKIVLPGYKDIRIEAGTDTAYIALWNPDTNPCYFKFTITRKEDGKQLYESGLIPPGEAVTKVTFNEKIPKGIYEATMRIQAFDLKDYTQPMNGGEVHVRIIGIEK